MKLMRTLLTLILALSVMVLPVIATGTEPSPEKKDPVQLHVTLDEEGNEIVGSIYDENDEFVRHIYRKEIIYTSLWEIENIKKEYDEEIEDTILDAAEELSADNWTELVFEFDKKWDEATDGAPIENAVVSYIFDARYVRVIDGASEELLEEGQYAELNFEVEFYSEDVAFVIGHKPNGEEMWIIEEHEVDEDGIVTVSFESLSPFVIVVDTAKAPGTDTAPDSPQTGVNEVMMTAAIFAAVVLCAAGFVCVKKFRKASAK